MRLTPGLSVLVRETSRKLSSKTIDLYYKSFTIIIYDHNDSTIVEPVL